MSLYVINGFSVKMLKNKVNTIKFTNINKKEFDKLKLKGKSFVGHRPLAKRAGVDYNRGTLKLDKGDIALCVFLDYKRYPTIHEQYGVYDDVKNLKYVKIEIVDSR